MNKQQSQPVILKKAISKQKKVAKQPKYEFKKIGSSNNSVILQQYLVISEEPKITKPINTVYKVIPHQHRDQNNNLVCNRQCQDLRNEFQIMSELDHENVFKPNFCKNNGKECTMGMPKADTDGFKFLIENMEKNLQISQTKTIFHQIAKGLDYIHKKDYTHNDLKLANFFLDKEGKEVKIADFGFSKKQENNNNIQDQYNRWVNRNKNTFSPEIFGFLASVKNNEEQVQGFCEKSADVFAFGLCLFQYIFYMPAFGNVATGDDPLYKFIYNGQNDQYWKIILNFAKNGKKNLTRICEQINNNTELQQILTLITKCLQPSAQQRPTAEQLVNDPWFNK